ncbi:hypothetical protein [Parafilimonas sp.]|uniref:hypothetical protein n=1 Tax=Parafilimonas sp. TaxID=1969739 RepID=UPI0039E286C4
MKSAQVLFFASLFFVSCGANKNNIPQNSFADTSLVHEVNVKRFLFDNTKSETAGNADWVIDEDNNLAKRLPTPPQENINALTPETYWTGALSSWGIALVKQKQQVETLQEGGHITYGDSKNAQDLLHYDVFIIDEPNIRFSDNEKTAIVSFVQNGGGLFMIADHDHSDRNNDGWDSPAIWNDLMNNNPVQKDPFGFSIYLTNISQRSSNITADTNLIMQGPQGKVTALQFNNGTTITLTSPAAKGLFWMNNYPQNKIRAMAAYSTYGKGRIVVVGDSSPADDGSGAKGNKLHDGWDAVGNSHSTFFINASLWLAKEEVSKAD